MKEVNSQLTSSSSNLFINIIEKQIVMNTGAIVGLTEEEKKKIDLIYEYV